jgi:hypothetical protein
MKFWFAFAPLSSARPIVPALVSVQYTSALALAV